MSKIRAALIVCPCWSNICPPLGMPYLASMLKHIGHEVKCFDLNIELYNLLKQERIDYWDFGNNYYWTDPNRFSKVLLPLIAEYLKNKIEEILEYNPEIIGFSVFDTSALASLYVAEKIKEIMPDKKIIFGGPECFKERNGHRFLHSGFVDMVVVGEGEDTLAELLDRGGLEKIPGSIFKQDGQIVDGGIRNKMKDINTIYFPDYSDLGIIRYKQFALPIITSRGCIARCSFCGEMLYMKKYRYRTAENILQELIQGVKKYKVREFLFNDSLINGNLNELSRLVDLIIENKLDISWGGYIRVNPKMDIDLLRRMKKSGCSYLSYGIESGSQKVLNDMNKRISLEDAEKNLQDTNLSGIYAHVNWIVGFPTETVLDFLKSLAFVYKNKKYIFNLNSGQTCGIPVDFDLYKYPERYKISKRPFLNNWRTSDFTNTILHRRIRLKIFHKWLALLKIRYT